MKLSAFYLSFQKINYNAKNIIYQEGEKAEYIYLIKHGEVKIT